MSSIHERDFCPICGAWIPVGRHICPPPWYVQFDDARAGEGRTVVYAESGKDAAERFCRDHDAKGNYDVIHEGEAWVLVFDASMKNPRVFHAMASSMPTYSAYPDDGRTEAARQLMEGDGKSG